MAKECDISPEKPYTPAPELAALAAKPKRYLIVVDEGLANESCPVPTEYLDEEGRGHRVGKIKLHPYDYPEQRPPLGFIVMPSMKPIESIQEKFPDAYFVLKEQGIKNFPYNGP